ncbi:MAG: helix-turn-helix domain-containing protein [Burkholderiales bacterium]
MAVALIYSRSGIYDQERVMGTQTTEVRSAKDLGAAISAARKALGLPQAQAALLCGVGIRFLSELENGKATARLGEALRVIAGLGLALTVGPKKPFWAKDDRGA